MSVCLSLIFTRLEIVSENLFVDQLRREYPSQNKIRQWINFFANGGMSNDEAIDKDE